ncbi:MAG: amidase family protein [Roseibium sp.]
MSAKFPWSVETVKNRLDAALDKSSGNPTAENVFIKFLETRARSQVKTSAKIDHPLAGALISLKALFDVKGEVTTSATRVLLNDRPADIDAVVVRRLEEAGGVFVGLTNMSEFAYSGLGLNPHYGTPQNVLYPGCAPGGSTSGGAVSVALGICDVAIGSDTGGSLRIPAAFNGIVGFKPTQRSVPMDGGKPLSCSLDSFGPIARTVEECELVWQVMAGHDPVAAKPQKPQLIVPTNFGFDEIDTGILKGFKEVVRRLKNAGIEVLEKAVPSIDLYAHVPPWHMTAVESRGCYEEHFQATPDQFDKRVLARMALADKLSAVEYRQSLNRRAALIKAFDEDMGDDILLLPTTPNMPPKIEDLAEDETFNKQNLLALRNTSLGNIADACSIALPYENDGLVLSAMLTARGGLDENLLACAKSVEMALTTK